MKPDDVEIKETCVDCGKDRIQITETPRYHPNGFLCKPCRIVRVNKQIKDFQESGDETNYTDNLKCPHCGDENNDSWEIQPDSGDHVCGNCDGEFFYEREISVTYTTTKK